MALISFILILFKGAIYESQKSSYPCRWFRNTFLPATKALAKEMLPIVDKPTIQFIVEEALKSGIEDILVVTGKSKRSIEDHFDSNFELEYNLKEKGKNELLKLVDETTGIRLHFIRQSHPRGLEMLCYKQKPSLVMNLLLLC